MSNKVSQSRVQAWRTCRMQAHLKYNENLRKKRIKRPFAFGSLAHEMWEAYGAGDDAFEVLDRIDPSKLKMFRAEQEEYGDLINDLRCIMSEYFEHWKNNSITYLRRNKRSTEHPFEVEHDDIILVGKIDAVGQTPNRLRWLVEHKTSGRPPLNEDHRWRNLQSAVYIRIMEMLDWWKVDGTCWDHVLSKPPAYPQFLESGKMSQKAINTLPSRVMETLKEHKLNPADFKHLIETAMKNRVHYFERIFTRANKDTIDILFQDFVNSANEFMELRHKSSAITHTIGRHCDWCDFEPICRARFKGLDIDYVKEREYYVAKPEDKEITTIAAEG
jgi:hypothetical protein